MISEERDRQIWLGLRRQKVGRDFFLLNPVQTIAVIKAAVKSSVCCATQLFRLHFVTCICDNIIRKMPTPGSAGPWKRRKIS